MCGAGLTPSWWRCPCDSGWLVLTNCFFSCSPLCRTKLLPPASRSSLGFAGTILLKSDEDLAFAQQQQPLNMLAAVGQPWETASL